METASSVNGQIMPPVMGRLPLMIEYVGIPYTDIIRHALLPAVISYIALFYIVHLEALKLGIQPMMASGKPKTFTQKLAGWGMGTAGTLIVMGLVYWIGVGVQAVAGEAAIWILLLLLLVLYVFLLKVAADHEDLPTDINVNTPVRPEPWPTVRAGLYFLIPIGILVWCLTVEVMSAGLSAFWAVVAMLFQMATQRPIIAWFRKQATAQPLRQGVSEVWTGLQEGARNMVGIGIACGTAGLIVGAITLTGLGLRMTAFVELVSMGNVLVMLFFTAAVCLVLGLGMPTTANYILMATLMAPVVVELGAQSGMVIPLIAVHMFVFYYGIMADITPPVGLATFAAAAISGEDPIKTGVQGVTYAMRTAVLPFMFIFNPMLLLIGIHSAWELVLVVVGATVASLAFAAATMGWLRIKTSWLETILLLLVTFMLFRPDWFMDHVSEKYQSRPASELMQVVQSTPTGQSGGATGRDEPGRQGFAENGCRVPACLAGRDQATGLAAASKRLSLAGLTVMAFGDTAQVASVAFGSSARRAGWEQGWDIQQVKVPHPDRPSEFWVFVPAFLILIWLWTRQGVRMRRALPPHGAAQT
nr:TRAP transporter fused permease subunit [Alcaligenes faecalis]